MNVHILTASSVTATFAGAGLAQAHARNDRELLRLCRRVMAALAREAETEQRYMAALEAYEAAEPLRPLIPVQDRMLPEDRPEYQPAVFMRREIKRCRRYWHAEKIARYRERIARVAAHEKALAALDKATGLSRADAAQKRAIAAVRVAIEALPDVEAMSPAGAAAKAEVLVTACNRRFTMDEEIFANLALSIAADSMYLASHPSVRQSGH